MGKARYNPEKRAWRGKSYRKGAQSIKELKDLNATEDYTIREDKTMKVIIVYELVPEETKIYSVAVEPEELEKLKLCQNHYNNTVTVTEEQQAALDWLDSWLRTAKPLSLDEPLAITGQELLFHTGFIL